MISIQIILPLNLLSFYHIDPKIRKPLKKIENENFALIRRIRENWSKGLYFKATKKVKFTLIGAFAQN